MSLNGSIVPHLCLALMISGLTAQDSSSNRIPPDAAVGFASIRASDLERHLKFLAGSAAQGRPARAANPDRRMGLL